MTWLRTMLIQMVARKYLLGWLVALYKLVDGKKTLLVGLASTAVVGGKLLGLIPPDVEAVLLAWLGGTGGVTLLDKFRKYDEQYRITATAARMAAEAHALAMASKAPSAGTEIPPAGSPEAAIAAAAAKVVDDLK